MSTQPAESIADQEMSECSTSRKTFIFIRKADYIEWMKQSKGPVPSFLNCLYSLVRKLLSYIPQWTRSRKICIIRNKTFSCCMIYWYKILTLQENSMRIQRKLIIISSYWEVWSNSLSVHFSKWQMRWLGTENTWWITHYK